MTDPLEQPTPSSPDTGAQAPKSAELLAFVPFPKMARLHREVIVTEKIDGTNGCVLVTEDGEVLAGSRSRWITPEMDNHGFARWVRDNADDLRNLGPGRHFGEWWGSGIQRRYGLSEKRFSLFNVGRWAEERPDCCHVVPVLWRGLLQPGALAQVEEALERLRIEGSVAAPGFMKPEGVIVWHVAGNFGLKRTIERDEEPKGALAQRPAEGSGR